MGLADPLDAHARLRQNAITARRRRALAWILEPVLGHPRAIARWSRSVALGGALQAIVQPVAQQLPDMAGMVGNPVSRSITDVMREGPLVGVEAVRASALTQRLVDGGKRWLGQARAIPVGPRPASASSPPCWSRHASG